MKWFLVVYFLVGDSWYPGDVVEPDGWSSIEHPSKEICETRKEFMNNVIDNSDMAGLMKGVCQEHSPNSI